MRRVLLTVVVGLSLATSGSALGSSAHPPRSSNRHVSGIGIRHSFGPHSSGWGIVKPSHLYNGGDGSGDITDITWSSWGGATAHGRGKNSIFKPTGGYYRHPVTIKLRAEDPGSCGSSGSIAYRHLFVSEPRKPGGPFGRWRIWTNYHRNLCKRFQ